MPVKELPSSPFPYVCFRQYIFQIRSTFEKNDQVLYFSKTFLHESPILTQVIKLSSHKTGK